MSRLAEQNIIGSLLLDPSCMDEMYHRLTVDMFSSKILGRVYLEFQRGYDNGYPVDLVILEQKLQGENFSSDLLLQEMNDCMKNTVTSAVAGSYIEVVEKDYKARRFGQILDDVKILPDRVDDQILNLRNELDLLLESRQSNLKTVAEITRENEERYFCEADVPKIRTGFSKLDGILGGLEGGEMVVIGARPGVGKSAFVTQIMLRLGKEGKRVGFYNLEMKEKQIYERLVAAESGLGLTRICRASRFLPGEKERFDKANQVLQMDNIIISSGNKSVSEIRTESRHMGYDVIIIDYLQLLKVDGNYKGNRYAEVGAISRGIKAVAMELDIPVIALSQLNRALETRNVKEPTMADLRDAGDIEQDASVIMFLWDLPGAEKGKKGCKIEKQRQGRTGRVALHFDGDLMRFRETSESVNEVREWEQIRYEDCPFPKGE